MRIVQKTIADAIHLFAQQSQNEGNCGNVFFNGTKLYSYGRHYLLAEFITNKKGIQAVMINNVGYSVSTSKHIGLITRATRDKKQFFSTQCEESKVLHQLQNLAAKLVKAKKPQIYISQAVGLLTRFDDWQDFNGKSNNTVNLKEITKLRKLFLNDSTLLSYKVKIEKLEVSKAKKKAIELKTELLKFYDHKTDFLRYDFDYLRVSENGENIETSQRVKIPMIEAVKLFKAIKAGIDIRGYRLSNYIIKSIDAKKLIAGCHTIEVSEILRIGKIIAS